MIRRLFNSKPHLTAVFLIATNIILACFYLNPSFVGGPTGFCSLVLSALINGLAIWIAGETPEIDTSTQKRNY
jgi:hypothetical protein